MSFQMDAIYESVRVSADNVENSIFIRNGKLEYRSSSKVEKKKKTTTKICQLFMKNV